MFITSTQLTSSLRLEVTYMFNNGILKLKALYNNDNNFGKHTYQFIYV